MQNYPFIHSADLTNPADNLELLCAHDHPAQEVEWLWPGKIPIGKVSMIIGDPGTGKTLLALDIAARASVSGNWPDQSTPLAPREEIRLAERDAYTPASTLILSATDDFQDTLRPRLDAAGADPRRIFYIPSITDLRHDIAQLRAAVERAPNVRLIIIDPINAFVGPTDSHFHSVLRRVLEPLAKLAAEKRIAVIAIAHLRKNDGAAIHRAAGSMGFVAAARSVWSLARDNENPGRTLLLPIKTNLTQDAHGLAFTINSSDINGAPTLQWHPTPIDAPNNSPRRADITELNTARLWLAKALAAGPRNAAELTDEAAQFGIHERTLRRALHALGGQTNNRGILDGWWWSLPAIEDRTLVAPGHGSAVADSAGGSSHDNASPTPPPGKAGGYRLQTTDIPATSPNVPDFSTRSSLLDPRSSTAPQNPVPSCPLSENSNIHASSCARVSGPRTPTDRRSPTSENIHAAGTTIPTPDVNTSIRALNRLARQRKSSPPHKTPSNSKQSPKTTGHPILDEILNSIRDCIAKQPPDSPNRNSPAPRSKLPPINQVTTATSDDLTKDENLLWPVSSPLKLEGASRGSPQERSCAQTADSGHG